MRIVLCYPVEPRHLAEIQRAAPHAELVAAGQEGIAAALPQADVYCGHAKVPVPWDEVVRGHRLQWIQSSAAGLDHCLVPDIVASDIRVTSASGVLADQVADHTLALTLAAIRSLPIFFRAQAAREFVRRPTRDLHGSTVGIVGMGGNGRRLADVFSAFRTRVVATDWFPFDKPSSVAELWPASDLPKLLKTSDVVVLAAPLNEQTRGMIDASTLAEIKPGEILVNMARGPLVVEADVIEALEQGLLACYATDVTDPEPLPPASLLWERPDVIITPHVGGQAAWRLDRMTDLFCENLRRFESGAPLINLVDKRLGFPAREPAGRDAQP